MTEMLPKYPASEIAVLAETLREQIERLAGCADGSHERRVLERVCEALDAFDGMIHETDVRRWPSAHILHDAAVLMADYLAKEPECHHRGVLVKAIEAFERARDRPCDIERQVLTPPGASMSVRTFVVLELEDGFYVEEWRDGLPQPHRSGPYPDHAAAQRQATTLQALLGKTLH